MYERLSYFVLLILGLGLNYSFMFYSQIKTAHEIINCEMAAIQMLRSDAHGYFLISGS